MIASLRGRLAVEDLDGLVIEVGGVGLRVHASSAAAGRARQSPELVSLQTELIVREDALTLYGFADVDERDLFNLLRGVTGVGPRIALAILSVHGPAVVRRAIVDGRHRAADAGSRASAASSPSASRSSCASGSGRRAPRRSPAAAAGDGEYRAAREALVALGFSVAQADEGLAATSGDAGDRLRAALAVLGAAAMSDERLTVPEDRGDEDEPRARCGRGGSPSSSGRATSASSSPCSSTRRRRAASRSTTCCCSAPGPRQDDARPHHRRRDGGALTSVSGPAIDRKGDLAAILTGLGDGDVLFLDEIHRLSRTVEELLYSAMEDRAIDIMVGQGAGRPRAAPVAAAVHARRRDDALEPALEAAARSLRHELPARALRARRPRGDREALGRHPRDRDRRRGRARDRRPLARHAARREPPAAAGSRLRAGAPREGGSTPTGRARRSSRKLMPKR